MRHPALIIILSLLCLANNAKAQQGIFRELALKGDSCMKIHDTFHAMQFYIAGVEADSTDIGIRRKLASCYRKVGDNRACVNCLDRMPKDSVSHDDMRMFYYSYLSLGNSAKAATWGERITERYPYDSDVTASLASLYNSTNKPERAEITTKNYITQCDSTNIFVNSEYAYSLFLQLKYDEAIPQYEKIIANGNDDYKSNFVLGMCYDGSNDTAKARKHLAKAASLKDDSSYCLYRLALTEEALMMDSLAAEHFNRSLETAMPQSRAFRTYAKLASVYFALHKYAEAARAFELAIAYDSDDKALNYYNAAQMFIADGNTIKADLYLRLFIEKANKPNNDEYTKELIETARKQLGRKQ